MMNKSVQIFRKIHAPISKNMRTQSLSDRQKDRVKPIYPQNFVCWGYKNIFCYSYIKNETYSFTLPDSYGFVSLMYSVCKNSLTIMNSSEL